MRLGLRRRALFSKRKRLPQLDSSRILVIGFLVIIIIGSLLLKLPVASRSGVSTPYLSCLFTATSATCVTGLTVYDSGDYWSLFGQTVILLLIQLGGLGFMTMATVFSMLLRKNVSFKDRLTTAAALNLESSGGFSELIKHIIGGTFIFEGCGALILSIRFIKDFGFFGGIYRGIFTSVSAFCNAGFDIFGAEKFGSSLSHYRGDMTVNITVMLLVVIGGLGFIVWEEIFSGKSFRRYTVFTKIVLITTAALLLFGIVAFSVLEYVNPASLGTLTPLEKVLTSLFNSVTLRTAGFATIDYGALKELTKVICIILMFVGGSSGSTAGGVKVSTVALLFFVIVSAVRGRSRVIIYKRKISEETVIRALTLVCIAVLISGMACFVIAATERLPFIDVLFECVSAFCTVGLSTGMTPTLSPLSLIILIGLMFFGRVGLFTVTCALFTDRNGGDELMDYPETRIMIG